ncbi:MAG: ATP-binding protein [Acidobacteria bacterium]|nr:ATP-binding protein [Acidobacteriota bacterium]
MRFFQSIRWRLQLWHGVMLALVLTGFGVTAWRLDRATLFQRADQDLERRVAVIAGAIRGDGAPGRPPQAQARPPQDRPPQDRPPRDRPPQDRPDFGTRQAPRPDAPEPDPDASVSDTAAEIAVYYVAWDADGRELLRSALAPGDVPRPERVAGQRATRLRGALREYIHFTPRGECILVGRDISTELAGLRRFAVLLAGAGSAVFAIGLAVGWWISTRALRPIAGISATAARISTGDLTQRIPIADSGSELDDLARVLNDTFARLQASFDRQAQFTADASHELRTPVTVVLTQTQNALARERSAADYRDSLASCQRAAQRMRRLTESLLTLARLDSGNTADRSLCELDRVAADAIDLLRPLAQQQDVTLSADLLPARCEGHAEQLGQVVANLVSNALYYNRPGGTVQVSVSSGPDAAVLSVHDTGLGIAPDDLPHIFERFYRADIARSSAAGRTGLGLAITKSIVDAHGGSIKVVSTPGKGSTFTVRLPAGPSVPA